MTKNQLIETIRRVIKETLEESSPATAPSKPKTEPGTIEKPETEEPKKPRRSLEPEDPSTLPKVAPKAGAKKATMNEAEMLAKIIKRFRAIKKNG